jgi:hypothetical protein
MFDPAPVKIRCPEGFPEARRTRAVAPLSNFSKDLAPLLLIGSHEGKATLCDYPRAGQKTNPGITRFTSRHAPRLELPIRSVVTTPARRGYFRAPLEPGGASS